MRSKKLISLLLAAALTTSSLPMVMATGVAAEDAATNAVTELDFSNATVTYSNTASDKSESNGSNTNAGGGYLHAGPRYDRWAGLRFYLPKLEQGKTYYISYDMRNAVPSNSVFSVRVYGKQSNGANAIAVENLYPNPADTSTEGTNGSKGAYWRPTAATNAPYDANDSSAIFVVDIPATGEWSHVELKFANVSTTYTNPYLYFCGGTNGTFHQPFDIDNFKLYTRKGDVDNGEIEIIFETDFDNGLPKGDYYFCNDGTTTVVGYTTENYKRIAASKSSTNTAAVTYDFGEGVTVAPGIYNFSAQLRHAYYDNATGTLNGVKDRPVADNDLDITVTAVIDGEPVTLIAGEKADANWTSVMSMLTFEEGATISEIKIVTDEYEQDVDIRNVAFKAVQAFEEDSRSEEGFEFIDLPDYDFVDADGVRVGIDGRISSYEEGNKYARLYNRSNNWVGFKIDTNHLTFDTDKEYYLTFDVRNPAEAANKNNTVIGFVYAHGKRLQNNISGFSFTADGFTKADYYSGFGEEWVNVVVPYNHKGVFSDFIKDATVIGSTSGSQSNPFDFDNVGVYYIKDGQKKFIYTEDFQDAPVGALTGDYADRFSVLAADVRTGYATVIEDEPYYTATTESISYTPDSAMVLDPGTYVLNAQFSYPKWIPGDCVWGGDQNQHIQQDNNNYAVTASLELANGAVLTAEPVKAGQIWADASLVFALDEATAIKKITYTFDGETPIMFRNADIMCQIPEGLEGLDETNYLEGASVSYNGITETTEVETNGYLYVGERTAAASQNFITFQLPTAIAAGTKCYLGFDVKTAEGGSMVIRPLFNGTVTKEAQPFGLKAEDFPACTALELEDGEDPFTNGLNGHFIIYNENSEIKGEWGRAQESNPDGTPVYKPWRRLITYSFGSTSQYFEGYFTLTADSPSPKITFNRGTSPSQIGAIVIDNLKVWTDSGVIYENNFDDGNMNAGDLVVTTTAKELKTMVDATYTTLTPAVGETATVTYDVAALELGDGTYNFKIQAATADKGETGNAQIIFNLSDGTTKKSTKVAIGNDYTDLAAYVKLDEGVTIESVQLVTDVASALNFRFAELNYTAGNKGGMPNIGIVMVLLAKKQNGVRTRVVTKEFIEDGDFEANVIINDKGETVQTVESKGWYARLMDSQETKLALVTEDGNSFIRVTDLNMAQRGVYYNTGVVLPAGEYTLSVDLRVSEKATDANYTAYKWRTAAGAMQSMRANMQNPDNINNPHYAPFDSVDKDTFANDQGSTVGWGKDITNKWTTYTDKIVLEKDTLCVLKIGGYTGGEVDSHGFDIDNLSIKGKTTVTTGTPAEEEDKRPGGNLIENGNFKTEPTIIAGDQYDAEKGNAWFQNDGAGFEKDEAGKDLEDKPIQINHKIEWTDGYLTFSGRTNNLRQFWFNTGLTLEPGDYKLSIDFKTAVKGETSSVRVSADKLFAATVEDALSITNTWATKTVEFTVNEATPLKLNFYGGPGAAFKHSFCVDNVKLVKVK